MKDGRLHYLMRGRTTMRFNTILDTDEKQKKLLTDEIKRRMSEKRHQSPIIEVD